MSREVAHHLPAGETKLRHSANNDEKNMHIKIRDIHAKSRGQEKVGQLTESHLLFMSSQSGQEEEAQTGGGGVG